jgi:hypothetical protein
MSTAAGAILPTKPAAPLNFPPNHPAGSQVMGGDEVIPPIQPGLIMPTILGNGALFKFGVKGGDLDKVFHFFEDEIRRSPEAIGAQMDLALLHLLRHNRDQAYQVQARALERQQLFRVVGSAGKELPARRRVLALMAPGDFTNNAQLEFILDGGDVGLDALYIVPGQPLPAALPDHDVAFCAVNESDENLPILRRLSGLLARWPRPVLNRPERVARLSRNGVAELLEGADEVCVPQINRVPIADLRFIASGAVALDDLLPDICYPILVRPVGSHGGKNLIKINEAEGLATCLLRFEGRVEEFFVSPFFDYRRVDGFFRKYRIVFFEGKPFLCHVAISRQWMVHYLSAGMAEDASKRAEEALAMHTFERAFARRHQTALNAISERLGLDYFVLDCGELPDGRLLFFEADIAMVIHSIDSPTIFPYKPAQMAKVFAAFRAMIDRRSSRPAGSKAG